MNKYEAAEILHEPVGNEREGMQAYSTMGSISGFVSGFNSRIP
jgi:hypothetical protein